MKINITGKNYKVSQRLSDQIEKKIGKLDKYFADDAAAHVVLSKERDKDKIEVTINAKGMLIRAEEAADDMYEAIDLVIDKLVHQIRKFRGRLKARYNDKQALKFEFLDEIDDEEEEAEEEKVVRTKTFDLRPMDVDEAILEMEMLQHDFFVFFNSETDSVNVVYKRKGSTYGLLEPQYK